MKNLKDMITESGDKEYRRKVNQALNGIDKALKTDCVEELKSTNLYDWFIGKYPDEEKYVRKMDRGLTLFDVIDAMQNGEDFYEYTGVTDSVDRERIFSKLSEVMSIDYDCIYYLWMYSSKIAANKYYNK